MLPERTTASPWWQDILRFWLPVLGLGSVLVIQLVGLQRQIGELRVERTALGADLTAKIAAESASLREEMSMLRADLTAKIAAESASLREEVSNLRVDLGERITRLEAVVAVRFERPPESDGTGRDDPAD